MTSIIYLAPIYDCGSCLFPKLSDEGINKILNDENEVNKRIFSFPKPALLINNERFSYYEIIRKLNNEQMDNSLLKIYLKINLDSIDKIIDNTLCISDLRKKFYKTIIKERICKLIKEPLIEKLILSQKDNLKHMSNIILDKLELYSKILQENDTFTEVKKIKEDILFDR